MDHALEQLMEYCQIEESEAERGVAYYRERYNVVGYYENKPYKGIRKLLPKLKERLQTGSCFFQTTQGMVDAVLEHLNSMNILMSSRVVMSIFQE